MFYDPLPASSYAWTTAIESTEDYVRSPGSPFKFTGGLCSAQPAYLSSASSRPEHAPPFTRITDSNHASDDGGGLAERADLGWKGPVLLEYIIDPELLVPGTLQANYWEGKHEQPRQHMESSPLGLDGLGGRSFAHSSAALSQQERHVPQPPPTMPRPNPSRSVDVHSKGDSAHCCSFLAQSFPDCLPYSRRKLLTWASNLSRWSTFQIQNADMNMMPLPPGKWMYEVKEYRLVNRHEGKTHWMPIRHRFFVDGDSFQSAPQRLFFAGEGKWLEGKVMLLDELWIRCERPGHSMMSIRAWMHPQDEFINNDNIEMGLATGRLG